MTYDEAEAFVWDFMTAMSDADNFPMKPSYQQDKEDFRLRMIAALQSPLPADNSAEMLDSIKKLMDQVESLRETLSSVMGQSEHDLKSAHAEICKLQGLDPSKHTWPAWSPQMNSLHWFGTIREKFGLDTRDDSRNTCAILCPQLERGK